MEVFAILLVAAAVIWLISALVSHNAKESAGKGSPTETSPGTGAAASATGTSGAGKSATVTSGSGPTVQPKRHESLDSRFARAHGLWVCRYCETINGSAAAVCVACGKRRDG